MALLHKSFFAQNRHCEERFLRRGNPDFSFKNWIAAPKRFAGSQ